MKRSFFIYAVIVFLTACGITSPLSKLPEEDKGVYSLLEKVKDKPASEAFKSELASQYESSVLMHQQNIEAYSQSNDPAKWEKIMKEYGHLEKLANSIAASPAAAKVVPVKRFTDEYNTARTRAVEQYYEQAVTYLNYDDRENAKQAYELFRKVNQLSPGYKDVKRLTDEAYNKSILKVVINPVNYYSQSYSYWGLQNDYMQQELLRDLKFQLSNSNVKVYTNYEASANHIVPDRVVELNWNELFLPIPRTNTFSRQVSNTIQTGETSEKKPIYTTVRATIYVTQRIIENRGTLSCKVIEPATNKVVLWDDFPVNNSTVEEYATYRGDSRALSSYDWALINNSRFRNLSRYDMFNNVFRQVYPQLLSRLRYINW